MTKKIPEINDLLDGINDHDIHLNAKEQESAEEGTTSQASTIKEGSAEESPNMVLAGGDDTCWQHFLAHLEQPEEHTTREERLVCKLERDLADSLDECDIHNHCRSDLVNAIVRAFFSTYLSRLMPYRREKKSLFLTYNPSAK